MADFLRRLLVVELENSQVDVLIVGNLQHVTALELVLVGVIVARITNSDVVYLAFDFIVGLANTVADVIDLLDKSITGEALVISV